MADTSGPDDGEDANEDARLTKPWGPGLFYQTEADWQRHQALERGEDAPRWPSPADRALRLGGRGQRVPSPFPSIDASTRGGLRTRRLVVFGGAPGAGKTTALVQLGLELAKLGVLVGILASDEDADGLLVRIGQQLGLAREELEEPTCTTCERKIGEGKDDCSCETPIVPVRATFARYLSSLPNLLLVDAEDENAAVEDVSKEIRRRRQKGQPSVLIVDSIQTVRSTTATEGITDKKRIDCVVAALKLAAKADGHLVLATSELNRGAYRSQDSKENSAGLAAFKESGGVEYGAAYALVMRSVKDAPDAVDVEVVKNRIGGLLPEFRLMLDRKRAGFVEVEKPDEEELTDRRAKSLKTAKDRILRAVEKQIEPLRTKAAVLRRTEHKGKCVGRTAGWAALEELQEDGAIVFEGGVFVIPAKTKDASK